MVDIWIIYGESMVNLWLIVNSYPLVNIQKAMENGPIEIVDLPSYKMAVFHSYVNVYQRVTYGGWQSEIRITS